MKITYDVAKEKGSNRYYAHQVGFPHAPLLGSMGDKKRALHFAAQVMGLPYKEYLKLRRERHDER